MLRSNRLVRKHRRWLIFTRPDYGTSQMGAEISRLAGDPVLRPPQGFAMSGHQDSLVAYGADMEMESAGQLLLASLGKAKQLHLRCATRD